MVGVVDRAAFTNGTGVLCWARLEEAVHVFCLGVGRLVWDGLVLVGLGRSSKLSLPEDMK